MFDNVCSFIHTRTYQEGEGEEEIHREVSGGMKKVEEVEVDPELDGSLSQWVEMDLNHLGD